MSATSAGSARWPAPGSERASEAAASAERAVWVTTTRAPALGEKARARRSDAARAADDERQPAAEGMRHEPAPYLIGGMGRLASPGRMTKA